MTREEMIRKVCEAFIEESTLKYGNDSIECSVCSYDNRERLLHKDRCPVLFAEKLLSMPVIEVGDVVSWSLGEGNFRVLTIRNDKYGDSYEIIKLRGSWNLAQSANLRDLTLVRKGAKP